METCKNCDIKFNGTNCPICGKKKSAGGILEGILLVTAIIFATLVVASTGGVFAFIIYILLYKSINEKYKLLLANTCLVLGLFIGTAIFKYTDKLPVEYETYITIGIGLLILTGYYSYKFMYKSALNNSKGLWDNVENIVTTKSYTGKTEVFLNALKNDTKYQESLRQVHLSIDKIDKAGEAAVKAKEKADKSYEEYAKKYGKKGADNMIADIKANKFKWGSWTDADRKRYSGK